MLQSFLQKFNQTFSAMKHLYLFNLILQVAKDVFLTVFIMLRILRELYCVIAKQTYTYIRNVHRTINLCLLV